ncbi:MAG TPA: hypothetical protein PLQ23_14225 [Dermatophilaceae bacterium]|nr:hypothetical protein [Dermatophilaceae bacterium]
MDRKTQKAVDAAIEKAHEGSCTAFRVVSRQTGVVVVGNIATRSAAEAERDRLGQQAAVQDVRHLGERQDYDVQTVSGLHLPPAAEG